MEEEFSGVETALETVLDKSVCNSTTVSFFEM
jgi:hypothetical protein